MKTAATLTPEEKVLATLCRFEVGAVPITAFNTPSEVNALAKLTRKGLAYFDRRGRRYRPTAVGQAKAVRS